MKHSIVIAALFFVALSVFAAACGRADNVGEQPAQEAAVEAAPEVEVKEGCAYDNPPCNASYDCASNSCVLKTGCNYGNPSCDSNHNCIDNICVLKEGCKYGNPPCNSSQICQNNKCFEHILSSGGGGY